MSILFDFLGELLGEAVTEIFRRPASSKWRDKRNWRQLRRAMTMDEVRALLGEPEKVFAGKLTQWYWNYPSGPEVYFDRSGKLDGWSEPGR